MIRSHRQVFAGHQIGVVVLAWGMTLILGTLAWLLLRPALDYAHFPGFTGQPLTPPNSLKDVLTTAKQLPVVHAPAPRDKPPSTNGPLRVVGFHDRASMAAPPNLAPAGSVGPGVYIPIPTPPAPDPIVIVIPTPDPTPDPVVVVDPTPDPVVIIDVPPVDVPPADPVVDCLTIVDVTVGGPCDVAAATDTSSGG